MKFFFVCFLDIYALNSTPLKTLKNPSYTFHPPSLPIYLLSQESGLAGRTSGTDSYSHVFLTTEDYVKQRSFASRDGCNRENIDELFKLINTQPSKQSGTDFMHIIPHEQHKAFSSLDDYSNRQWKVTSLYIMETEIYLDLKELAIKTALQLAQSAEGELVKYLGGKV